MQLFLYLRRHFRMCQHSIGLAARGVADEGQFKGPLSTIELGNGINALAGSSLWYTTSSTFFQVAKPLPQSNRSSCFLFTLGLHQRTVNQLATPQVNKGLLTIGIEESVHSFIWQA